MCIAALWIALAVDVQKPGGWNLRDDRVRECEGSALAFAFPVSDELGGAKLAFGRDVRTAVSAGTQGHLSEAIAASGGWANGSRTAAENARFGIVKILKRSHHVAPLTQVEQERLGIALPAVEFCGRNSPRLWQDARPKNPTTLHSRSGWRHGGCLVLG